jgi:hypothetical protein
MQQLGFDLIFKLSGTGELHGASVCIAGDFCGAAHDVQFVFVFEQTHLVEQFAHIVYFIRRAYAAAGFGLHRRAQLEDARIPLCCCAQRVKQRGLIAH